MYVNLLFGILINIVVLMQFSRFFSKTVLKSVVVLNFVFLVFLSIFCFYEVGYLNEVVVINFHNWINLGFIKINLGLLYDSLTLTMVFVVIFISSLVHLYSFSYMKTDPFFLRFISYLSLFTFFMLVLVTANNYLQLLIGWEGVGLSSYLLICFWYTRVAANLAAIKAMLINRIGDVCLIIVICIFLQKLGSVNYGVVNNNIIFLLNNYIDIFFFEVKIIDVICLLLLLGAMGKSAQIMLHVWLPDAMEGPTPVSALIHAATMVTAGIFLVIRSSRLFEFSPNILFLMVFIGSVTCLAMSIIGAFQQDIKKIVAYSTCSQLGYMFIGCGLSSYTISLFHLFNHAFFKALLFLSMGVIIHALGDEQDLRKMGSLINFLPLTSVMVFFGSYALLGLPFLAGFYSKDILLEIANVRMYFDGYFSYILGIIGAFFTAFYSTRLMLRVFFNYSNVNKNNMYHIHEADLFMYIPLILLLLCSFFVGYFFFDVFVGLGTIFFNTSIYTNFQNYSIINIEYDISNVIKLIPLFISILGFFVYYYLDLKIYIYYYNFLFKKIYKIIFNGFFFDKLYIDNILINLLYFSSESYYINIETGFLQKMLLVFIDNVFVNFYKSIKIFTKGFLHIYVLIIIFFIINFYIIFTFFYYFSINMFLTGIILICFSSFLKWNILSDLLTSLNDLYKKKKKI